MDTNNNSNNSSSNPTNPVPTSTPPVPVDPTSPAGIAFTDISNAASALQPVLGPPESKADLKRLARVPGKALGLIPTVLQLAVIKPELAPKGTDPQALLQELQLVDALKVVAHAAGGVKSSTDDAVRVKLADIWHAVMSIYVVAQQIKGDPLVNDMVAKVAAVLARGPRTQKSTHTPIKPLPTGKRAQKALAMKANEAEAAPSATPPETPAAPAVPSSAPTPTKVG